MIAAARKDDALLADIRGAEEAPDCFHLWWLGQSGFLLKWDQQFLLFDPYLSDSLTRKYHGTDKPHVRMSELVIDPARLDFLDVVTSSHNHTDHLDGESLRAIAGASGGIRLVLPEANLAFARERLGEAQVEYHGVDSGRRISAGPWEISGIAAAHNEVERDAEGRCKFLGFAVKFGEFCVYHSGDTLWHDGLVEELRPFSVDVAMLPINGNKPERRVAGNLNGVEAAELGAAIGAKLVVPCHYHMFTFNTEEPDRFVAACERAGQEFRVMRGGERLTVGTAGSADGSSAD
ncbi:MAG: MBL fold metallo-hydrolase [Akkermansiaceae bacterium]|nr:MBL fold metallo-hydrolase [Akkermansiaceae bacterium]NNM28003.1 MBL fold metallo-hydrolase [Akkermansiaceae bacterium]